MDQRKNEVSLLNGLQADTEGYSVMADSKMQKLSYSNLTLN